MLEINPQAIKWYIVKTGYADAQIKDKTLRNEGISNPLWSQAIGELVRYIDLDPQCGISKVENMPNPYTIAVQVYDVGRAATTLRNIFGAKVMMGESFSEDKSQSIKEAPKAISPQDAKGRGAPAPMSPEELKSRGISYFGDSASRDDINIMEQLPDFLMKGGEGYSHSFLKIRNFIINNGIKFYYVTHYTLSPNDTYVSYYVKAEFGKNVDFSGVDVSEMDYPFEIDESQLNSMDNACNLALTKYCGLAKSESPLGMQSMFLLTVPEHEVVTSNYVKGYDWQTRALDKARIKEALELTYFSADKTEQARVQGISAYNVQTIPEGRKRFKTKVPKPKDENAEEGFLDDTSTVEKNKIYTASLDDLVEGYNEQPQEEPQMEGAEAGGDIQSPDSTRAYTITEIGLAFKSFGYVSGYYKINDNPQEMIVPLPDEMRDISYYITEDAEDLLEKFSEEVFNVNPINFNFLSDTFKSITANNNVENGVFVNIREYELDFDKLQPKPLRR